MNMSQREERFAARLIELATRDVDRATRGDACEAHRRVATFMVDELERYAAELAVADDTTSRMREEVRRLRGAISVARIGAETAQRAA